MSERDTADFRWVAKAVLGRHGTSKTDRIWPYATPRRH